MRSLISALAAAAMILAGCSTPNAKKNAEILGGLGIVAAGVAGYVVLANRADAAKLTHFDAGDPTPSSDTANPSIWRTQTIVWGVDRSQGMPPRPSPMPAGQAGAWYFDFPACGAGHVDYVTFNHGPLSGASGIDFRYRIETSANAKIVPWTNTALPSLLTLYFQRRGDNWTGTGPFETYRWYDSPLTVMGLTAGENTISASFSDDWTAIETSKRSTSPAAFAAALTDAQAMGIVFGGDTGLGHGACVMGGTARFVMEGYTVH